MSLPKEDALKIRVQRYIVWTSVLLLVGKFIAFFVTNSVGVLTDAMESIVNVTAGFISLYSIRLAAKPKDDDHPFGHGKVELISASLEGLMIMVAGGLIIFEGVRRLFVPSEVGQLDTGIVVVAVAGAVNYAMGWYSIRTGKKFGSIALVAGGRHLQSDTYSTIGLVVGLILLYVTGLVWIDSALALLFGGIIVVTGIQILRKTVSNLMDKADVSALETMVATINRCRHSDWIDVHNLKAVRYGNFLYIDCDLTLPWYYNVAQGHDSCDQLRDTIVEAFHGKAAVAVHADPCKPKQCVHCNIAECPSRSAACESPLNLNLRYMISDEARIAQGMK